MAIMVVKVKSKMCYILLFIFIIFILIASKGLRAPQPGDENVYYYMGRLITEGKAPYKDFFYAHPPLHIYLMALIYGIFGFNIVILKSVPLIAALTSAFFIFRMAKEKFGYAGALISSSLFIFSYSVMFNSVFSFGIEIAATLFIIGFYFLDSKNNYTLAAIFFGLAATTRLLSLIPIFVIFIIVLLSNKRGLLKLSSIFLIIFLLVNGIFTILYGGDYLTQVYKYHLLKTMNSKENFKEYADTIKLNWILFSSALLVIFIKEKKPHNTFMVVSIAYLIFLIALRKIFGFYFLIIFPFLAIIGGCTISMIFKKINLPKKFIVAISAILLLIFGWNLVSDVIFLEKIGFTGFERGKDLADFIASNSGKNTLLFGDDSVVPLLALLTNKRIALDFADTNDQVFSSGIRSISLTLRELNGKDILFIIRSKQGISYFSEVKEFLNKNCEFLSQFHDKIEGDYLVYRCG